jgi:hypothetical protein
LKEGAHALTLHRSRRRVQKYEWTVDNLGGGTPKTLQAIGSGRASSQALPTPPVPPPPSPELALILRSLEAINETLKGRQPSGTEVEPPSSRMGNPEVSRDSGGGPPPKDITRELHNIKFSEFVGGRASECEEAWLEGMTRCFSLRDYASNSTAKISIFQLRDSTLKWWGKLERQLYLTPNIVSWELFEERFRRKYLPTYYKEQ